MARITVEDCIDKMSSRFELVLLAAQRAKELAAGARPLVKKEGINKFSVLSLVEIASGLLDIKALRAEALKKRQTSYPALQEDKYDSNTEEITAISSSILEEMVDESESVGRVGGDPLVTNMYATESYDDEIVVEEESK